MKLVQSVQMVGGGQVSETVDGETSSFIFSVFSIFTVVILQAKLVELLIL